MSLRLSLPVLALLCGCQAQIQHGLDERQANELQAVLGEHGIDASKVFEPGKKPTWALEVDEGSSAEAIRLLAELGLPRPRIDGIGEVFGKGSLVPTPTEERALYLQALSGELSRTLESVEGVTSARVHLVLPPPQRPGLEPIPAKASAFLRVRRGAASHVNSTRDELRALIAGSVEGLSLDGVTLVIDEAAGTPSQPARTLVANRLRWLVIALGGTLSAVAMVLVLLTLKLRQYRAAAEVANAALVKGGKPLVTSPAVVDRIAPRRVTS